MLLTDFDFELPRELIAQYPITPRSNSRLLLLQKDTGIITHHLFKDLPKLLSTGDLLTLNDSKVIPARIHAFKPTGGKAELLVIKILKPNQLLAQIKASNPLKIGNRLILNQTSELEIIDRQSNFYELKLYSSDSINTLLEKIGMLPLPPYIKRKPNPNDQIQYQTIYAKSLGAIAAPTAGLHFDQETLHQLKQKKIYTEFITLHVGAGTFQPVRVKKIEEHQIHAESLEISEENCKKINQTKQNNARVVAVGTTTIRALETAAHSNKLEPYQGETRIFIYPGYKFQIADILITNFHLPKTTLLMLVAAFAGYENTIRAYQEAIKEHYRFYSYGDAMMVI